jgi:anti-anti-sigma factor
VSALAEITDERRGEVALAHVKGEIDASNAAWIGARLRALLSNRSDALAIDLLQTTYLDSAGIALLFGLASQLRLHQQVLRLVVAEGSGIRRMIALTGLDAVVPTFPTIEAAFGDRGSAPSPG